MTIEEIVNVLDNSEYPGVEISFRIGILTATRLLYLHQDKYYYFDSNDMIEFSEENALSKAELINQFPYHFQIEQFIV